jgi:hypothetical protein
MDTLVLATVVILVWVATGFGGGTAWLERRTGLEGRIRGNAGDATDIQ